MPNQSGERGENGAANGAFAPRDFNDGIGRLHGGLGCYVGFLRTMKSKWLSLGAGQGRRAQAEEHVVHRIALAPGAAISSSWVHPMIGAGTATGRAAAATV